MPACSAAAEVSVRVWAGGAPAWARAHYALEAREDVAPGAALGAPLQALSPLNRALIYTLLEEEPGALEIHFDTGECPPVARPRPSRLSPLTNHRSVLSRSPRRRH